MRELLLDLERGEEVDRGNGSAELSRLDVTGLTAREVQTSKGRQLGCRQQLLEVRLGRIAPRRIALKREIKRDDRWKRFCLSEKRQNRVVALNRDAAEGCARKRVDDGMSADL